MRAIIIVAIAALLALQVVRTAMVDDRRTWPNIAFRLWPSHPSVLIDRTMAEIGASAARGETLPAPTLQRVEAIAAKAPLAPEPFLIQGALAQLEGEEARAERLFAAARLRDPRSRAARYFLAEWYLRTGRTEQALIEMGVLSRLLPQVVGQLAPRLATFARTPGAVPVLRKFFRTSPEFEPVVLSQLASDPKNVDLILALRTNHGGSGAEPEAAEWQTKLLAALVEQGQFAKARSVWQRLSGVKPDQGTVFNPGFRKVSARPPFNWTFAAEGGVVEPLPGDRLQVIYYGRGDAVLAEQLVLLEPGRYQLATGISGSIGGDAEIAWTLTCVSQDEPLLRLAIEQTGRLAGSFVVPPGCLAQRLQLTASAGEFRKSQEFTVGRLSLVRGSGT